MTASVALHLVALALYLAAAVVYGANLSLKHHGHARRGRVLLALAVAVHTAAIGAVCVLTHRSPIATAFGSLSTTAWAIGIACLVVEASGRVPVMGALAAPLCCLLVFGGLLRPGPDLRMSRELQNSVVSVHVLLVLVSFAVFVLAGCCAAFYLWQYRLLRRRPHPHGLFRLLPPLDTLDTLAFRLVAFGLPLLSLGLVLGIARAASGGLEGAWKQDLHTLVSYALWILYAGYLAGRNTAGLRGTRGCYVLIAGVVVSLALFVLPTVTHRFS